MGFPYFVYYSGSLLNEIAPVMNHIMHRYSVLLIVGDEMGVNERPRRANSAMAPQLPEMVTPIRNATAALIMVKCGVNNRGM